MSDLTNVTATGDSALSEYLRGLSFQSDLPSRLAVSGATLTFQAGTGAYGTPTAPFSLALNGHVRTITAPQTLTATGAAGTQYLVADLSGAGPGFTLSLQPTLHTSGTQMTLAALWFDGTALAAGAVAPLDYSTALHLNGLALSLPVMTVTDTGDTAGSAVLAQDCLTYTTPTNMQSIYFTVPTMTRARISYTATLTTICPVATPLTAYVTTVVVLGSGGTVFNVAADYTGQSQALVGMGKTDFVMLTPGLWQFTVKVGVAGKASATFWACRAFVELTSGEQT